MNSFPSPEDRASSEAHAWVARLNGEPSPEDRRKFERWYAEDPAHRLAYDRVASDWTDHYGLVARTSAGRGRTGIPALTDRRRPVGLALAAASFAILLAASLLLLRPGAEPAARAEIIATATGEIRTFTLSDRSRVTLDTGSRVAVRYKEEERRIELQAGRARFRVREIAGRPFVVQADGGEIVARDTVFDVSLVPGGATVSTIEGAVEVQVPASTEPPAERRRLQPGEGILIHSEGRLQALPAPSANAVSWPSGMLEFRATPLRDAVAQANRYSNRRIRIADPATAGLRVTGNFRAGDTVGLARSLAAAFSLRLEESEGGEIVLRSAN